MSLHVSSGAMQQASKHMHISYRLWLWAWHKHYNILWWLHSNYELLYIIRVRHFSLHNEANLHCYFILQMSFCYLHSLLGLSLIGDFFILIYSRFKTYLLFCSLNHFHSRVYVFALQTDFTNFYTRANRFLFLISFIFLFCFLLLLTGVIKWSALGFRFRLGKNLVIAFVIFKLRHRR